MSHVQIEIKQKTYPARTGSAPHVAIKDLSIALNAGEFVCLVGPSGCGKTTLLNIISGLDPQFDGSINIGGGAGSHRIGYVFQNPRLLPWRTVRENIDLALPPGLAAEDEVERLLAVMGLAEVQSQFPQRLSLGMSRRVSLVRAFAIQPTLLLMDEPFVSLDAPTARRVRESLVNVWLERPHTVLFVTHDLREAITLADRLIFLTPPPTQVMYEIAVDIPRAERGEESLIEGFRQQLISGHPEIKSLL